MLMLCVQTRIRHISTGGRLGYGFTIITSDSKHIYMEYFEETASGAAPLKSTIQLRYVHDTYIHWPHQETVQILLDHMNSVRVGQFTIEERK